MMAGQRAPFCSLSRATGSTTERVDSAGAEPAACTLLRAFADHQSVKLGSVYPIVRPTPEFATGPSGQLPIVHCYGYFVGVCWRICRLDPASRRGGLALRLSAAWGREGNAADAFLVGTVAVALGSSLGIASGGCPVSECGAVSADPFGVAERDCASDGVGSCARSRGVVAGAVDCWIASTCPTFDGCGAPTSCWTAETGSRTPTASPCKVPGTAGSAGCDGLCTCEESAFVTCFCDFWASTTASERSADGPGIATASVPLEISDWTRVVVGSASRPPRTIEKPAIETETPIAV